MNDPKSSRPPSFLSRARSAFKALFPVNRDERADPPANPARANRGSGGNWNNPKAREGFEGKEPFLSPGQPLEPKMDQGEPPRRFQVPPGYNIQIQPRSTEAISFAQLRAMGDFTIIRVIIEHVKESLKAHEWDIVPDEKEDPSKYESEIKKIKEFFEMPDRAHTWDEWLGELIEEVLVVDALTIFKRKTRGGGLYGLEIIDGTTIKTLADYRGFEPMAPLPAYQQFIFGVPYAAYTRDEMYYLPRNRRANKFYGYSPVEQMIVTVNQGLRRELYSLAQLTDGNIPTGVGSLPKEWKLEDIKAYQEYWDLILSGDPQNRSRIRFVPEGFNYTKFNSGTDSDGMGIFSPFDEWLARIMCFGIGISPMPFIKMTNRSVAEEMGDVEAEGGVGSLKLFIERICNRVIDYELGYPHLCFNWITDRGRMQSKRVNRNVAYAGAGILQIDEIRAEEGLDPLGLPPGYPTPGGYKTFQGAIDQEAAAIEGAKAQTELALNPPPPQQDPNKIDPKTGKPFEQPKSEMVQGNGKTPPLKTDDKIKSKAKSEESSAMDRTQKAWLKCRSDELDKWERFALARSNSIKAVQFDPEYLDPEEASAIKGEIVRAMRDNAEGIEKATLSKAFDDEVRHVFATRRAKVPTIRLAPAAARDAAHHVGDLSNVLNAVFQREAQRIARERSR